ncbi:MAG: trimethylamine methyltransferase family protein [Armatimonadota bacterium]
MAFNWLSDDDVERMNEASLQILQEIGIRFEKESVRELLWDSGCTEGDGPEMVRIPRELVDECVGEAPETFELASLDGSMRKIGPEQPPVFWTGNALYFDEGRSIRPIETPEFVDLCRVAQECEMIHAMVGTALHDYPAETRDFVGFRIMANNFDGHLRPCIYTPDGTVAMREMAEVLLDGTPLSERPIFSLGFTAVSPLQWSALGLESFEKSSGHGIPMMVNSEPVAGATAPVTLAGALTIGNAEALAGVVALQLLEPGRPTIFNIGFAHTMDMRTAVTRTGSPECALIQSAAAQFTRFHGMPSASWSSTESMMADSQAAYESLLTGMAHAMGGVSIVWGAGNLESTRVMSLPQLVIDNELARVGTRVARGIEVTDETIAADVIKEMGTAAQYLGCDHTMDHFRELVEPEVTYTASREGWQNAGSRSMTEVAAEKAEEILAAEHTPLIDDDTDAALAEIEERWMKRLVE